jgi:hypothetical protein
MRAPPATRPSSSAIGSRQPSQLTPADLVEQAIVEVAKANQTDGYRMVTAFVCRKLGVAVNRKRVLRPRTGAIPATDPFERARTTPRRTTPRSRAIQDSADPNPQPRRDKRWIEV